MKNKGLVPMTVREFFDKSVNEACTLMGQIVVIKKLKESNGSHGAIEEDVLSMDAGDAFRYIETARREGVFTSEYDFAINKVREALQQYGAI